MLSIDALKGAIDEAKINKDVSRYEKAVRALAEVAPSDPDASLDAAWVQETNRYVQTQTERLEHELRGYKNNLIKESIRVSNDKYPWKMRDTDLYRWAMRIWATIITRLVI